MPAHAAAPPAPASPASPVTATPPPRPVHWSNYLKVLAHLALGMVGLVLAAAGDGISALEALQLAAYFAGSVAVYAARNSTDGVWAYTKAVCAWLTVALTASLPWAQHGWAGVLDGAPVILAAAVGALGVGILPNTGATTLADAVRDTLAEVQLLRALTTGAQPAPQSQVSFPAVVSYSSGGGQVRGTHAPATPAQPATAGARPAASPVDTGTLDTVRARSAPGFLG